MREAIVSEKIAAPVEKVAAGVEAGNLETGQLANSRHPGSCQCFPFTWQGMAASCGQGELPAGKMRCNRLARVQDVGRSGCRGQAAGRPGRKVAAPPSTPASPTDRGGAKSHLLPRYSPEAAGIPSLAVRIVHIIMATSGDALEALSASINNALALVAQLDAVVSNAAAQKQVGDASNANDVNGAQPEAILPTASNGSIDALSLAHDAAMLIKAHATKISLLIINEPFTPTAITKVLRDLVTSPVPSLAAAVEGCVPGRYTRGIQHELAWRAGRVLKELKELLLRIPTDGKVLSDNKKNASAGAAGGKGSIATTGVLWSACDDVMAFAKRGFAGNIAHKIEQLRDTLKDVMEELKEWGEETEDDDEGSDGDESDEDDGGIAQVTSDLEASSITATRDTQAILDDLMNSQRYIPRDDPDRIRERLDSCLKRLRLTTLLYQATVKRRIKPLPHSLPDSHSDIPARLDEVMSIFKRIPERFGSLAMAFYELDPSEIDRLMDECFFDAFAASELLVRPWEGQKDEFTDWALRFQVEIKKG